MQVDERLDAVVVGAGFAGMYMLYRLRELGLRVRLFERGDGVGGTWYWNRYPGARCDVESMEYSYQFSEALQQEWSWSERYAAQPEILRYANHVADRFNLRAYMQFNASVQAAHFNETTRTWCIDIALQDVADEAITQLKVSSQFCIMATGCLSSTNLPSIAGLDKYQGDWYHTGRWPHHEVAFNGQRVGVIGTGSSGIQSIPIIAQQAAELTVFQRTPNYSIPVRNAPIDPDYVRAVKADYAGFRARNSLMPAGFGANFERGDGSALEADETQRRADFEKRWQRGGFGFLSGFNDFLSNARANETAAEFVRDKIRGLVRDPDVAQRLCPEQVIGCKRLCLDTDYYETFNRDNVRLVDVRANPISCFTESGVRTTNAQGKTTDHPLDAVVFATGFDAMTGTLLNIDIRGRKQQTLAQKWSAGPRTYLGLQTAEFPNLFMISGPGSPSVLTNMIVSIEQHVNWVTELIRHMRAQSFQLVEAEQSAEDKWVNHVNDIASATLYPSCNSWYLGANVPGKPRVFMPYLGFPAYVEQCTQVAAQGYLGFRFA